MAFRTFAPSIAAALLAGTALLAPTASAQQLTLEGVMSAPFPLDLAASPVDGRVAWVSNERGVRNIMIAERKREGGFDARPLTRYTQDNGYELDRLTWAANGTALVYTGGGSLEGGGPVNTQSRASGPMAKEILAQRLDRTTARNLGPGEMPTASPRDSRITFLRGGQIWLADLGGDDAPKQLLVDRGNSGGVVWSPDASKLAFLSRRPDGQILLGIYDFALAKVTWVAPSTDRDVSPVWSSDGRRIAWVRSPASKAQSVRGFLPNRAGPPWSIWVADAATGEGKAVWRADPGPGSVFKNVEDGSMLHWSSDDRLVFPWEKTGWIRLYSVPSAGGQPVALTPDGAELFAAEIDPTGKRIVFSSNATDDDHRHLWDVATVGGAPRMLTRGATIEDLPEIAKDGTLYAFHGSARDPMTPVVLSDGGAMTPLYTPDASRSFPRAALVVPERVVFSSSDRLNVHGQLFRPTTVATGRKPAVLFFHGGPQRQMLLGWHPMGAYTHLYAMNQLLASEGFIVLSVNFRGGTGYGLNWREPIDFAESGGSELRDIQGAVAYLKSRPDVDPARIGIYGMSYGGVMTALGLANMPTAFAGGVDIAGVHNWKSFLPYLTEPGAPIPRADVAYAASPIANAKDWRAPVLFIHGDDDRAVNFSQTVELVAALRETGRVEPEMLVLPDEVHDFIRYRSWIRVFDRTQEFLNRTVKNKK